MKQILLSVIAPLTSAFGGAMVGAGLTYWIAGRAEVRRQRKVSENTRADNKAASANTNGFWKCIGGFLKHYCIVLVCLVPFLTLVSVCIAFLAGIAWLVDKVDAVKRMIMLCTPYGSSIPWILVGLAVFLIVSLPNAWGRFQKFFASIRKISKGGFEIQFDQSFVEVPRLNEKDVDLVVERVGEWMKQNAGISGARKNEDPNSKSATDKPDKDVNQAKTSEFVQKIRSHEQEIADFILEQHGKDIGATLKKRSVRFKSGLHIFDGIYENGPDLIVAEVKTDRILLGGSSMLSRVISQYRNGVKAERHLDPSHIRLHILIAVASGHNLSAVATRGFKSILQDNPDVSYYFVEVPPDFFQAKSDDPNRSHE